MEPSIATGTASKRGSVATMIPANTDALDGSAESTGSRLGRPLRRAERYSKSIGEARLMIGNAIRMMARAPKSRAGCHFSAAIGLRSLLEEFVPTIPDWANDQHTLAGKKLGRGLDHFRKEGAKLIPEPTVPDPYIEEAYRLWQIKQQSK
jgi:hypothetical protein